MKHTLSERVCFLTSPLLENLSLDNFSTFFVDAKKNAFFDGSIKQDFFLRNSLFRDLEFAGSFLVCKKIKGEKNWDTKSEGTSGYVLISDDHSFLIVTFPLMQKYCTKLARRTNKIIAILENRGFSFLQKFDSECSVLLFNNENQELFLKNLELLQLSKKEKKILRLIVKKETEQSISEELDLSLERVEKQMKDLRKKLKCETQKQLLNKAAQLLLWGLI